MPALREFFTGSPREFFFGTPAELAAKAEIAELSAQSPNNRRLRRLNAAQGLSRRILIRRGVALVVGAGVVSVAGKYGYNAYEEYRQSAEEEVFFNSLNELPLPQRVAAIDKRYTSVRLSEETAKRRVLPIWLAHYRDVAAPELDVEDLAANYNLARPIEADGVEGRVKLYPHTELKDYPGINFAKHPSNVVENYAGERISGLVLARSIALHETGHYVAAFRNVTSFFEKLKSFGHFPDENNYTKVLSSGLSLIVNYGPDKNVRYFHDFLEAETDVVNSYVAERAGVPVAFGYEFSYYLMKFLEHIKYPKDRLMELHRTSNIEQFMVDMGQIAYRHHETRGIKPADSDAYLKEGYSILTNMTKDKLVNLEGAFPGVSEVARLPRKGIILN